MNGLEYIGRFFAVLSITSVVGAVAAIAWAIVGVFWLIGHVRISP